MAFPVDMLDNCSHEKLENSAEDYMLDLWCGDPENLECFPISLSNVGFVPLYCGDQTQKVLALFAPEDSLTAVALYLADQWWAIDDIVKTSVPSSEGLKQMPFSAYPWWPRARRYLPLSGPRGKANQYPPLTGVQEPPYLV
uniref:Uncharacterized protein n=1 Tax=Muntiacus reevesi TaxID=9886 RepID=A0A5N3VWN1_MUNRE|nr:hypothetical protein FD755_023625 [Muntiacus reevesi]KAB0353782.1 hypothetical protein FD755_023524 [Muntiacus reevesi]